MKDYLKGVLECPITLVSFYLKPLTIFQSLIGQACPTESCNSLDCICLKNCKCELALRFCEEMGDFGSSKHSLTIISLCFSSCFGMQS